jgi:protein-tyrosine phosphatase
MVATPHSYEVLEHGGIPVIEERLAALREKLEEQGIPIQLMAGMEQHLGPQVPELFAQGQALTLNNSRYMLVEFNPVQWATYTDEVLFQLQVQNVVPLLAHVERQANIQEKSELLEGLVQHGCYAQITAGSLLGNFGSESRATAERLLRRGMVHVVASDAHRPFGSREPLLAGVAKRLHQLVGEEATNTLLYDNPAAIVADGPVATIWPKPAPAGLRRFLPW